MLDYVTGPRVLLNIFYLLPVMLVAWATASTGYGLIVAAVSCLVTPVEAMLSGFRLDSLPVSLWNGLVRLAVFGIVLYLMENVRILTARLQEQALDRRAHRPGQPARLSRGRRQEIERSRRFDHELSLAYIDIDDFKATNDRLGHEAGDRMLIALASLALATARSVDTVARLGGDEFVIIMPETGADAALPLVTRLREAFPRVARVGDATTTCSIGLASFVHAPSSVDELLTAADALMYEAKAAGKDEVRHAVARPTRAAPAKAACCRSRRRRALTRTSAARAARAPAVDRPPATGDYSPASFAAIAATSSSSSICPGVTDRTGHEGDLETGAAVADDPGPAVALGAGLALGRGRRRLSGADATAAPRTRPRRAITHDCASKAARTTSQRAGSAAAEPGRPFVSERMAASLRRRSRSSSISVSALPRAPNSRALWSATAA